MNEHEFIYERLSRRHKWHGYPVENVSDSVISNLLMYHDWSKREKFPDAQLAILKQKSAYGEWKFTLPSNYPMEQVVDKEHALQQCKDEFDAFTGKMKQVTAAVRRSLMLPTDEQRKKISELYDDIESCLQEKVWRENF